MHRMGSRRSTPASESGSTLAASSVCAGSASTITLAGGSVCGRGAPPPPPPLREQEAAELRAALPDAVCDWVASLGRGLRPPAASPADALGRLWRDEVVLPGSADALTPAFYARVVVNAVLRSEAADGASAPALRDDAHARHAAALLGAEAALLFTPVRSGTPEDWLLLLDLVSSLYHPVAAASATTPPPPPLPPARRLAVLLVARDPPTLAGLLCHLHAAAPAEASYAQSRTPTEFLRRTLSAALSTCPAEAYRPCDVNALMPPPTPPLRARRQRSADAADAALTKELAALVGRGGAVWHGGAGAGGSLASSLSASRAASSLPGLARVPSGLPLCAVPPAVARRLRQSLLVWWDYVAVESLFLCSLMEAELAGARAASRGSSASSAAAAAAASTHPHSDFVFNLLHAGVRSEDAAVCKAALSALEHVLQHAVAAAGGDSLGRPAVVRRTGSLAALFARRGPRRGGGGSDGDGVNNDNGGGDDDARLLLDFSCDCVLRPHGALDALLHARAVHRSAGAGGGGGGGAAALRHQILAQVRRLIGAASLLRGSASVFVAEELVPRVDARPAALASVVAELLGDYRRRRHAAPLFLHAFVPPEEAGEMCFCFLKQALHHAVHPFAASLPVAVAAAAATITPAPAAPSPAQPHAHVLPPLAARGGAAASAAAAAVATGSCDAAASQELFVIVLDLCLQYPEAFLCGSLEDDDAGEAPLMLTFLQHLEWCAGGGGAAAAAAAASDEASVPPPSPGAHLSPAFASRFCLLLFRLAAFRASSGDGGGVVVGGATAAASLRRAEAFFAEGMLNLYLRLLFSGWEASPLPTATHRAGLLTYAAAALEGVVREGGGAGSTLGWLLAEKLVKMYCLRLLGRTGGPEGCGGRVLSTDLSALMGAYDLLRGWRKGAGDGGGSGGGDAAERRREEECEGGDDESVEAYLVAACWEAALHEASLRSQAAGCVCLLLDAAARGADAEEDEERASAAREGLARVVASLMRQTLKVVYFEPVGATAEEGGRQHAQQQALGKRQAPLLAPLHAAPSGRVAVDQMRDGHTAFKSLLATVLAVGEEGVGAGGGGAPVHRFVRKIVLRALEVEARALYRAAFAGSGGCPAAKKTVAAQRPPQAKAKPQPPPLRPLDEEEVVVVEALLADDEESAVVVTAVGAHKRQLAASKKAAEQSATQAKGKKRRAPPAAVGCTSQRVVASTAKKDLRASHLLSPAQKKHYAKHSLSARTAHGQFNASRTATGDPPSFSSPQRAKAPRGSKDGGASAAGRASPAAPALLRRKASAPRNGLPPPAADNDVPCLVVEPCASEAEAAAEAAQRREAEEVQAREAEEAARILCSIRDLQHALHHDRPPVHPRVTEEALGSSVAGRDGGSGAAPTKTPLRANRLSSLPAAPLPAEEAAARLQQRRSSIEASLADLLSGCGSAPTAVLPPAAVPKAAQAPGAGGGGGAARFVSAASGAPLATRSLFDRPPLAGLRSVPRQAPAHKKKKKAKKKEKEATAAAQGGGGEEQGSRRGQAKGLAALTGGGGGGGMPALSLLMQSLEDANEPRDQPVLEGLRRMQAALTIQCMVRRVAARRALLRGLPAAAASAALPSAASPSPPPAGLATLLLCRSSRREGGTEEEEVVEQPWPSLQLLAAEAAEEGHVRRVRAAAARRKSLGLDALLESGSGSGDGGMHATRALAECLRDPDAARTNLAEWMVGGALGRKKQVKAVHAALRIQCMFRFVRSKRAAAARSAERYYEATSGKGLSTLVRCVQSFLVHRGEEREEYMRRTTALRTLLTLLDELSPAGDRMEEAAAADAEPSPAAAAVQERPWGVFDDAADVRGSGDGGGPSEGGAGPGARAAGARKRRQSEGLQAVLEGGDGPTPALRKLRESLADVPVEQAAATPGSGDDAERRHAEDDGGGGRRDDGFRPARKRRQSEGIDAVLEGGDGDAPGLRKLRESLADVSMPEARHGEVEGFVPARKRRQSEGIDAVLEGTGSDAAPGLRKLRESLADVSSPPAAEVEGFAPARKRRQSEGIDAVLEGGDGDAPGLRKLRESLVADGTPEASEDEG